MPEPFNKNIFVSYTTLDQEINEEILLETENIFSKYGNVYIDLLHNKNILEPQQRVFEELNKSDLLIVINSKNIHNSKWVNIEIEKAKERDIQILFLDINEILKNNFQLLDHSPR